MDVEFFFHAIRTKKKHANIMKQHKPFVCLWCYLLFLSRYFFTRHDVCSVTLSFPPINNINFSKLMSLLLSPVLAQRVHMKIDLFIHPQFTAPAHSALIAGSSSLVLGCDSIGHSSCFHVMRQNNYLHTVLATTGNIAEE